MASRLNIYWAQVVLIPLVLSACAVWSPGNEHLKEAERLSREKKYDQAVAEYRRHIESRLKVKNRAEWENPYFYLILIGDVYLSAERVGEALESYEEAEKQGISTLLCADRYRSVARWYEERGDLDRALEVLKKYRDRDPLIFDSILDRVSREITSKEDTQPGNRV